MLLTKGRSFLQVKRADAGGKKLEGMTGEVMVDYSGATVGLSPLFPA